MSTFQMAKYSSSEPPMILKAILRIHNCVLAKTKDLVLVYNHGSLTKKKQYLDIKLLVHCQFFH